jgi:hypothetical protein
MNDFSEYYQIYCECFPNLIPDYETFCKKLGLNEKGTKILSYKEKAFAVFRENALLMLCERKESNKFLKNDLITSVESMIQKRNHRFIVLGHTNSHYLFPGVIGDEEVAFFDWKGYKFDGYCFDMMLEIDNNIWPNAPAYDGDEFDFRYRNDNEKEAVKNKGDEIDDGWGNLYADADRCLLAIEKSTREIAGAIIIDDDNPFNVTYPDAGGFGCVGICKPFRKMGLGMRLCKEAVQILSDMSIKKCFIGYTDLVSWYSKLGAVTITKYAMGKKCLDFIDDIDY